MPNLNNLDIKIGINPIVWSNDDMQDLGRDIPLERCLSEANKAGYSGIELGHKFPKDPIKLKSILKNHNLNLISGWHSTFFADKNKFDEEINNFKKHLFFLKEMGCKVIICAECTRTRHSSLEAEPRNQENLLNEEEWKSMINGINAIGKIANDEGLKLVYHHHMGTAVESPEELDRFMKETNQDVYLLADTGHFLYAGGNPLDLFTKYGNRIAHIHFKDIRKKVLEEVKNNKINFLNSVKKGIFTVPGDGCIDYESIIDEISKLNYNGWIVVEAEQDPKKANPFEYAKKGREFIKEKTGV